MKATLRQLPSHYVAVLLALAVISMLCGGSHLVGAEHLSIATVTLSVFAIGFLPALLFFILRLKKIFAAHDEQIVEYARVRAKMEAEIQVLLEEVHASV